MAALSFSCNKCPTQWEVEFSKEMMSALREHQQFLSHGESEEMMAHEHSEFECSGCGEKTDIACTHVE